MFIMVMKVTLTAVENVMAVLQASDAKNIMTVMGLFVVRANALLHNVGMLLLVLKKIAMMEIQSPKYAHMVRVLA